MIDAGKVAKAGYPYLVFALLLLYGLCSEKIPLNEGLGWHNTEVAARVTDISPLWKGELPAYTFKHILPVVTLHYIFKVFGMQPLAKEIVPACIVLNCVCIFGMLLLWKRIVARLDITWPGELAGAMALTLNGMVKFLMFYPSMVYDGPVYFCGMLICWLWLNSRQLLLFLLAVLGLVINELVVISSLILFIFPCPSAAVTIPAERRLSPWLTGTLLTLFAIGYGAFMASIDLTHFTMVNCTKMTGNDLMYLSIFVVMFYLVVALTDVFQAAPGLVPRRLGPVVWRAVAGLIVFAGGNKLIFALSSGFVHPMSVFPAMLYYYVGNATYDAPGYFFVIKLVSFGPLVVLAALYWRRFVDTVIRFGPGLALMLVAGVFRALETESRHYLEIFPLLMPFIVLACQPYLTNRRLLYFFLVSILFSKLWAPLALDFPEYYFWGFGSFFSSFRGYLVQLVATLFCVLFTCLVFRDETTDRGPALAKP